MSEDKQMTLGEFLYGQICSISTVRALPPGWALLEQSHRDKWERAADAVAVRALTFAAEERERALSEFGLQVIAENLAAQKADG